MKNPPIPPSQPTHHRAHDHKPGSDPSKPGGEMHPRIPQSSRNIKAYHIPGPEPPKRPSNNNNNDSSPPPPDGPRKVKDDYAVPHMNINTASFIFLSKNASLTGYSFDHELHVRVRIFTKITCI